MNIENFTFTGAFYCPAPRNCLALHVLLALYVRLIGSLQSVAISVFIARAPHWVPVVTKVFIRPDYHQSTLIELFIITNS